jgi:hypothetical protein
MKYSKERYREYLKSATWANIRAGVVSERGERCERCSSKYRIEVHHNKYPKIWGEERPEDLEVLCHRCHMSHHVQVAPAEKIETPKDWLYRYQVRTGALKKKKKTKKKQKKSRQKRDWFMDRYLSLALKRMSK